jgi:putative acetyltransferase
MLPDDGPMLATIFITGIEEMTGDDYSPSQRAAWIGAAEDEEAFAARLRDLLTLVATVDGEPVGFASLKSPDHIEMLYVSPASVGQGVATALCDALERLAHGRGADQVTVDASDTAQGFFALRGFEPQQRRTICVGDEWLGQTAMRKAFLAASGTRH